MTQTVVIFDGLCSLCVGSVRALKRLDWRHRLTYVDVQQWAFLETHYPALERDAVLGAIHVVTGDGRILAGYEAVRHVLRYLPALMWLVPLLHVPGVTWLGPRVYAFVAAHRYVFNRVLGLPAACDSDSCRVHHPD